MLASEMAESRGPRVRLRLQESFIPALRFLLVVARVLPMLLPMKCQPLLLMQPLLLHVNLAEVVGWVRRRWRC